MYMHQIIIYFLNKEIKLEYTHEKIIILNIKLFNVKYMLEKKIKYFFDSIRSADDMCHILSTCNKNFTSF